MNEHPCLLNGKNANCFGFQKGRTKTVKLNKNGILGWGIFEAVEKGRGRGKMEPRERMWREQPLLPRRGQPLEQKKESSDRNSEGSNRHY